MCWRGAITMRWLDLSVLLSFLLPCVRFNAFFILTFLALQCSKDPFTWKLSSRCSIKPLPTSPSLTLFPSSCLTADYSFSLLSSLIVFCFYRYALFRMSRYHGLLVLPATLLSSFPSLRFWWTNPLFLIFNLKIHSSPTGSSFFLRFSFPGAVV